MKNPIDELIEWVAASALFLLCFFIAAAVTGCTTNVDKILDMNPPVKCRSLDLPPVPQDVKLDIFANKIEANAGGETLLRGYVACRNLNSGKTK